jgi:hypothetical protein
MEDEKMADKTHEPDAIQPSNVQGPLDYDTTVKAAKAGDRGAGQYEIDEPGGSLHKTADLAAQETMAAVDKAMSAGGDDSMYAQAINESFSAGLFVAYTIRTYAGPVVNPITGAHMPKQPTVFDDILAAIAKIGK